MSGTALNQRCPECGLDLPAGTGGSGCPGCLLRLALSDQPAPAASAPSIPGLESRFFGEYEILGEIARGGMGVVYRARQLGLNRLVALKMVQSHHLLSDEARLRFRVEIEAVAQLSHPHIVSLYESGEHVGAHYFTMRLVEGGDLATHLKRGHPVRDLVRLLVKVCRAVHYAHQRGILHRDLKPSNILVDEQGEPHVADFGLAKSLDHDTGFTFTSSVLGSPNYMAPEQAAGRTRQLTTAVDVYGLGAVLYHLLAGVPPFQSRTPIDTLRRVVDHDPVRPRTLNPHADADLEIIALKCLRKAPGARYGTAEELALDLERWLAGRPIVARPLSPWAHAWRWSRRHPVAAALAVALVLAVVAIVAGTGVAAVRIQRAEAKAADSLRESLLRESASFRLGGEMGYREEALRRLREAATLGGSPEFRIRLRDELLATLPRTDVAFTPGWSSLAAARPEHLRLDDRFELLASVEHETNVVVRRVADGSAVGRPLATAAPITRIDGFSPNSRFLAVRHATTLMIWDLATGAPCVTHPGTNHTLAFAPHEDTVLLQESPNVVVCLELPAGRERFRWGTNPQRPGYRRTGWHSLAYSRDGRLLAGASGTSPILEVMNPLTGEQLRAMTNFTGHPVAMGWSRYGSALAVGTADGRVVSWNPATGAQRWASRPMVMPARAIAYHPRGDWVAVVGEDDRVRYFDDLAQELSVEQPGAGEQLVFSPDGLRLGPLRSAGGWGWLELRPSPEFTEFRVTGPSLRLSDARFSAEGRMLAVGHSDTVLLIDTQTGQRLRAKEDWRMAACAFHPGEAQLFVTGPEGILRHRYRFPEGGAVSFNRREVIQPGGNWRALAFSANGRFFAALDGQTHRAMVFDGTFTNQVGGAGPHPNAEMVGLHPEGRWLTTAGRADRSVRLWETATGRPILDQPVGLQPHGEFSPDGRWLALTGDREFHLLETGSWKPVPLVHPQDEPLILGAAVFSPDSRVLALVAGKFAIRLFDLERRELLGTLRAPGLTHQRGLAFSADGTRLAAVGPEARVAIWNLDAMGRHLSQFQFDWHVPRPPAAHP